MSTLTIASPAALMGPVRRVAEHGLRWQIQVRRIRLTGEEIVSRTFEYADRDAALSDFNTLRALGGHAYTEAGGYRLVLVDTKGR